MLAGLLRHQEISGSLVPDAQLAALSIEHGPVLCSTDTDFARFSEIRCENPLAR